MCLIISLRSVSRACSQDSSAEPGCGCACLCTRTQEEQSPLQAALICPHSYAFGYCFCFGFFLWFLAVWVAEGPCGLGKQEAWRRTCRVAAPWQTLQWLCCPVPGIWSHVHACTSCSKAVCSPEEQRNSGRGLQEFLLLLRSHSVCTVCVGWGGAEQTLSV